MTELPPFLLTELLYNKDIVLQASWDVRKENQLQSIYSTLPLYNFVPSQEAIRGCSREVPTPWSVSPIEAFVQFEGQSNQSYMEQTLAVEIGIRSFDKYLPQLGPSAATQTKKFLYMTFLKAASLMWHSILIYTRYPKGLGWFQHPLWVFEQLIWEANICIGCLVFQQRTWQMHLAWQSLQLTS